MKKIIALLLVCVMAVGFAACAKTTEQAPVEEEAVTEEQTPVEETPVEEQTPVEETPVEDETSVEDETPEAEDQDPAVADLLDKLAALVDGVNAEMMVENVEIPADQYSYQLFIDYVEGSHAVTSAPLIGSIAHSVCLLQLPEDADAEAIAQEIEANMDPRKWICVEAEATAVRTSGQYVLMVMSTQDTVDAILANFETVFGA